MQPDGSGVIPLTMGQTVPANSIEDAAGTTTETRPEAATEALRSRQPAYAVALACSLPGLQRIAREHGYALALHGSMVRDFDLVAVPWNEEPSTPGVLIEAIREKVGGFIRDESEFGHNPNSKPHGRMAWSIYLVKWDLPYLDISVMPTLRPDLNEMLVSARAHSKFLYDTACCTISNQSVKLAEATAETDSLRQKLHALRLVCGTTDADKFETALDRANAETAGLRALIVRLREFLSEVETAEDRSNLDGDSAEVVLQQLNDGAEELLKLTPADLADCVVVKRSEWEDVNNTASVRSDECDGLIGINAELKAKAEASSVVAEYWKDQWNKQTAERDRLRGVLSEVHMYLKDSPIVGDCRLTRSIMDALDAKSP